MRTVVTRNVSSRIEFPPSFFFTIKTDAPSESKKKTSLELKQQIVIVKLRNIKRNKQKIEDTTLQDFILQLIPYGIVGVVVNELKVQIK